jgi:hypothetical protein
VYAQQYFKICKEIELKLDKEHWYEDVPYSTETSEERKVTHLMGSTSANQ